MNLRRFHCCVITSCEQKFTARHHSVRIPPRATSLRCVRICLVCAPARALRRPEHGQCSLVVSIARAARAATSDRQWIGFGIGLLGIGLLVPLQPKVMARGPSGLPVARRRSRFHPLRGGAQRGLRAHWWAHAWIGLNDEEDEGNHVWSDGTPMDYHG